jgi:hypothetical protein
MNASSNDMDVLFCNTVCTEQVPGVLLGLLGPPSCMGADHEDACNCDAHKGTCTEAALIIEPLGSVLCGRSKPDIAEGSQVFPPYIFLMIVPSGSTISAATEMFCAVYLLASPSPLDAPWRDLSFSIGQRVC